MAISFQFDNCIPKIIKSFNNPLIIQLQSTVSHPSFMTHIQKALKAIDDRGNYQVLLLVLFIVVYVELGLILLGSSFVYMNPIFKCDNLKNPTEDQACAVIDTCTVVNDYTATFHADLYCSGQNERSFIQAAPYIGAIIGLLFLTPFADSKGKKKIFVIGQGLIMTGLLLNLIGIQTKISALIIIGQVILGAGCYTVLITGYVIISELTQDKFKQYSITILNAVWALTQVMISGFYFWYNYWQSYIIFVQIVPMGIVTAVIVFYLVESPYFLIEKKRDIEATMVSIRKIGRVNGASQEAIIEARGELELVLRELQEKDRVAAMNGEKAIDSRFAIFKDWKYLRILLIVAVLEFTANSFYYGVQFSLAQIGTDFGYNILLTGIIETTAYFTSNLFITKVPRRTGMLIFNLICVLMGLLFFIDFGSVAQTVLLGACRFFNTYTLAIMPMMQNEPFPHYYRSVAWGYIEGMSQIGNFITPYIVTGCQNGGVSPLIVLGFIMAFSGIVPLYFYKETLGVNEDKLLGIAKDEEEDMSRSIQTDNSMEEGLIPRREKNRQF